MRTRRATSRRARHRTTDRLSTRAARLTACHYQGSRHMTEQPEYRRLTREELDELAGEALPERAAMSLINANIAAPINAAIAAYVLSDNSVAYANAEQNVNITQST